MIFNHLNQLKIYTPKTVTYLWSSTSIEAFINDNSWSRKLKHTLDFQGLGIS